MRRSLAPKVRYLSSQPFKAAAVVNDRVGELNSLPLRGLRTDTRPDGLLVKSAPCTHARDCVIFGRGDDPNLVQHLRPSGLLLDRLNEQRHLE